MKSERITLLINNLQSITNTDVSALDRVILKYPYFQVGQLLLIKGLQNSNSIRYNQQLKRVAAYCLDRKKLFDLITLKKNKNPKIEIAKEINTKSLKKQLEIGTPLEFDENENHSFSEWITSLSIKKIKREEELKEKDLVDNFIQKEIKISRPKKEVFFKAINIAKESLIENNELVTPTLAKVYLEQKHYEKAISAYEKLILKYPKKSSLFASQIKLISKLNKK